MSMTDDQTRRSAARVPLDAPGDLFGKAAAWYSRRKYGAVLDNVRAVLHNRRVAVAVATFERRVEKWDALRADLKLLAEMASAASIGCSWCMDFGYYLAQDQGLDARKVEEVPRWRESDAFDELERQVMEYAEAMTVTPPTVTDELTEGLRAALGDEAFVELTAIVALENQRSRFNSALGLTSQGFKDRCALER